MTKHFIAIVFCLLLVMCFSAQADTSIDFESPTYTAGAAVNGQDGWVESSTTVTVENDATSGSQVIDFTGGVGSYRNASRVLDDSYSSGRVVATVMQYYITDKSGAVSLQDGSGASVVDFGIGKNLGTPTGVVFYANSGVDGLLLSPAPGGGARWIEVKMDVDLDSLRVDLSWRDLGGAWQLVFDDYAITAATISRINLSNSKIAAKFDTIEVAAPVEPGPTYIDFESPTYTVASAINGQDGWVEASDTVMVENDATLGSQVIDFTGGVGSYRNAYRVLNNTYSSGRMVATVMQYYTTDKSGAVSLQDGSGVSVVDFGIGKNLGTPTGVVFYANSGVDGLVLSAAPSGGLRWIEVKMDVDLDSLTVDLSWRELGGIWQLVFDDYAINAATIGRINLSNSKIAAKFDNLAVEIPAAGGATVIDFESPKYTVNAALDGQDGWSETSGIAEVLVDAVSGSQVLDFTDTSIGTYCNAYRAFETSYSSGLVQMTASLWFNTDRSGNITLNDDSGNPVLLFGIRKNVAGFPSGVVFYCNYGTSGEMVAAPPSGGARWIQLEMNIDLDNQMSELGWREIDGEFQPVFSDYALSAASIAQMRIANDKIAAKYDDIRLGPWLIGPQTCDDVWSNGYGLSADLNQDCHVNLIDVSTLAANWLDCVDPANPECNQ